MLRQHCGVLVSGCGAAGMPAIEAGASVITLGRSPKGGRDGDTRWTDANLLRKPDLQVSADFVDAFTRNAGYPSAPECVAESALSYKSWSPVLRTLPFSDPERN